MDKVAAEKELRDYVRAHPDDYVGVNERLLRAGGAPLKVRFSNRAGTVDAATAAAIDKA